MSKSLEREAREIAAVTSGHAPGVAYLVASSSGSYLAERPTRAEARDFAQLIADERQQVMDIVESSAGGEDRNVVDQVSPRPPARTPAGRRVKISSVDPATMTAGSINKELDRLGDRSSVLTRLMIEAGRGHERPSDYRHKTDPLSSEMNAISDRQSSLRIEIGSRWGPGAPSRLPSGRFWGPRKKS